MAKTKNRAAAVCSHCGSSEAMYVLLNNGSRLPSYALDLATGLISCYPCRDKSKGGN